MLSRIMLIHRGWVVIQNHSILLSMMTRNISLPRRARQHKANGPLRYYKSCHSLRVLAFSLSLSLFRSHLFPLLFYFPDLPPFSSSAILLMKRSLETSKCDFELGEYERKKKIQSDGKTARRRSRKKKLFGTTFLRV